MVVRQGVEIVKTGINQGALGIQCRDEAASLALLAAVEDRGTRLAVTAERAFLAELGGGCAVPIAAHAGLRDGALHLAGRVTAVDGSRQVEVSGRAPGGASLDDARELGRRLAGEALERGAAAILEAAREG